MSSQEQGNLDFKSNNEVFVGLDKMKENFLVFFLTVIILAILDIPLDSMKEGSYNDSFFVAAQFFGVIYFFFFSPIVEFGSDMIFLKGVRNEKAELGELFAGFKNYTNIVLANMLVVALVAMSLIALILPGIYVGCRLIFVSYLVMDKNLSPQEAIETSWKMTENKVGRIFVLGLIGIFICILGLICFIVGIIPAIMWVKSYFAVYYQMALNEQE